MIFVLDVDVTLCGVAFQNLNIVRIVFCQTLMIDLPFYLFVCLISNDMRPEVSLASDC